MPNGEQKTSMVEKPKAKAVKEPKPKKLTLVDIYKDIMVKGVKDKEEAVAKAVARCKTEGLTTSSRGNPITEASLLRHLTNIMRDIRRPRKGWWSEYKIEEKEGVSLKWVEI